MNIFKGNIIKEQICYQSELILKSNTLRIYDDDYDDAPCSESLKAFSLSSIDCITISSTRIVADDFNYNCIDFDTGSVLIWRHGFQKKVEDGR